MAALPPRHSVLALGSVAVGAVAGVRLAGWVPADRTIEVAVLIVGAVLTSCLRVQKASAADRAIMPPAFVPIVSSMMLFGPNVATIVAVAATLTTCSVTMRTAWLVTAIDTAIVICATQSAGFAYERTGGAVGVFLWPWTALPMIAAVLAYHVSQGLLAHVVVPAIRYRTLNREWISRALAGAPAYLLGAGVAATLVEVFDRALWDLAALLVASLFFAYLIYADYVRRLAEEHRRREVIDHLEQGMSVLDHDGRITLWNDALERILQCPHDRAAGWLLTDAVPSLTRTELPKAIADARSDGNPRILNHLRLQAGIETRILQVKVLPVADGLTLLWHDVTDRARAEHEIRRSGERLALAAEGANDGLWQWNLQTQEFYVSGRWRAMMGLPAYAAIGGPNEWLDRVHAEDIAPLKAALDEHLAGATPVFQHEPRMRHEDGTYRRCLSRGVAVRGAGRKSVACTS